MITMTPDFEKCLALPLLSANEEVALAKRIEQGDLTAKEKLTTHNLRLVVSAAKAYHNGEVELDELCGWGIEGLIRATEKFDYRKEKRFSTMALPWIESAIQRKSRQCGGSIKIPEGHDKIQCVALQAFVDEESPLDTIPDPNAPDPADVFAEANKYEGIDVKVLLASLPERNRVVIELLFGMKGPKRTGREVAKAMNTTENSIWKIHRSSLNKMYSMAVSTRMAEAIS